MDVNGGPDVVEQVPAGGGVNKPSSGTYGEGAALDRLKSSLPGVDSSSTNPAAVQPTPPPMGGQPAGPGASGAGSGLPAGLMFPSQQPDVPVSTALSAPPQNPVAGAVDERQKRLLFLQQLSESPEVSEETREWATLNYRKLIEASAA